MIEISHKQAQHLIREAQDRRLPEEQWAVLHAHLENCASCRAYREHLSGYERNLRRLLLMRWASARGPRGEIADIILRRRARRRKIRRIAGRAALYLLGVLLVAGFIFYRSVNAPEPEPPVLPTAAFGVGPVQTATPSPLQSEFRQVVAFESRQDGNAEIYLINGAPEGALLTNLTQNPAQDTQPAWSPDGQWIAFLSDRTGKNEVYITHVAGSRLTRITHTDDIDWSGPLAWSYDGKWLGLSGRRGGLSGGSFLYLVPLDGKTPPASIAYTYLAEPWMRFSSGQPALAYLSTRRPGALDVINTETGAVVTLAVQDEQNLFTAQSGDFDWSFSGTSLAYITRSAVQQAGSEGGAEIRISPEITTTNQRILLAGQGHVVDGLPAGNRLRAVSWVPNSLVIASLLASGEDAGQAPCWMIRLTNSNNPAQTPQTLPEICVTGGLGQANWSPDGKWLVVIGRQPSETESAFYALRLPQFTGREDTSRGDTLLAGSTYIERLADLPAADAPAPASLLEFSPVLHAEPRVRPGGALKDFRPRAAPAPAPSAEPLMPPAQARGWVAYTVQSGADSWIVRSRPDGRSNFVLTSTSGEHTCPRIAPDGSRIAYLSDDTGIADGFNEVFVTGLDRKNTVQLTRGAFLVISPTNAPGYSPPHYDCPVWSPDSKYLAAVHRTPGQNYLAIIPVDGQARAKYLMIEDASDFAPPVWVPRDAADPSAGSVEILLAYQRASRPTRLVSLNLETSQTMQPADTSLKLQFFNFDDIQHMAVSPDGGFLALSLVDQTIVGDIASIGRPQAGLQIVEMPSMKILSEIDLPNYDPSTTGMGGLFWLPDGSLGQVRVDALLGPRKTLFERIDPNAGRLQVKLETLASFDEVTYRAGWVEQRWVVFASESGFWALDLEQAQAGRASPALLSGEAITDVDWR